jgi:predicted MPP superfamily phosphohydrolase
VDSKIQIFIVNGNWENWKEVNLKDIKKGNNVFFVNGGIYKINKDISVIGYDDYLTAKQKTRKISSLGNECIALFHSPEFFDHIAGKCFLNLAGHTHGGQIKLPFIKPLWTPKGSGKYISGWYENKNSKLYVSRGIGTSLINMRLFSRPELAFITLTPETK